MTTRGLSLCVMLDAVRVLFPKRYVGSPGFWDKSLDHSLRWDDERNRFPGLTLHGLWRPGGLDAAARRAGVRRTQYGTSSESMGSTGRRLGLGTGIWLISSACSLRK